MVSNNDLNNDYGLAKMHEDLLDALIVLDKICRSNQICYTLHGGTLLGAERNHHFIPWDDDADVAMTSQNYNKFKKIVNEDKTLNGYYLDEQTLWVPRFVKQVGQDCVCVDILLWDYISENKILQRLKINLLRMIQGTLKEDIQLESFSLIEKCLLIITFLMGRPFKKATKVRLLNTIGTKLFVGKKKFIHRYNDSFRGITYILDRAYMEDYTDIEFEGIKLMVNKRYHEFLIAEYGPDYITPPDIKDRHPLHEKIRESIRINRNT